MSSRGELVLGVVADHCYEAVTRDARLLLALEALRCTSRWLRAHTQHHSERMLRWRDLFGSFRAHHEEHIEWSRAVEITRLLSHLCFVIATRDYTHRIRLLPLIEYALRGAPGDEYVVATPDSLFDCTNFAMCYDTLTIPLRYRHTLIWTYGADLSNLMRTTSLGYALQGNLLPYMEAAESIYRKFAKRTDNGAPPPPKRLRPQ